MKKTRVYDVPTRLFHWIFAGLFVGAFVIAKYVDDDSSVYPYHMLMGLTLGLTVVLRIIWGFFGSTYAKFSSYPLKPMQLVKYFKNILTAKTDRSLGHNPASAWAALALMACALGSGVTGYLMASGSKETYEDIHELFANGFLIFAISHVAGVAFHAFRHRDGIAFSMVSGKKESINGDAGIGRTHAGVALVFLTVVGLFVFNLNKNYDPSRRTLNLFGNTLELGESESD